jgi:hypothetical protein
MPHNSIAEAIRKLRESSLASGLDTRGCTGEQIRALESELGFQLPSTYREFLLLAGNGAGRFLIGTDWTFTTLHNLGDAARRLLRECGVDVTILSPTAFVFAMHQGYQFLYFDAAGDDDPPVLLFLEGEPGPRQVFNTFADWLVRCVDDEIEAFRHLGE